MAEKKFAILLNADKTSVGPAANGLEYALDLDDAGYTAEVYFDGAATEWPAVLDRKPDNPVNKYFNEAVERGLIGGACGYCANAFGVYDDVDEAGVELLGGRENHGPDVGALVSEGYELITVG
ncbi:hypothetical protein [Haladaptatus sp. DJG-WS-42]|uniref:hypothetical protein n=1 Tax=Haladaptatus sp. DJG-WS-42 TaxID=3120516 RepID=UPI0030D3490F